jgi:hypothetical protein
MKPLLNNTVSHFAGGTSRSGSKPDRAIPKVALVLSASATTGIMVSLPGGPECKGIP